MSRFRADSHAEYPYEKLRDSSGLSVKPTADNYAGVTHALSTRGNTTHWLTNTTGSINYFDAGSIEPQFKLSLDGSYHLTALVVWGVGSNDEASDFTVEFSTDVGTTYSSRMETVATSHHLGTASAALAFAPGGRRANTVRLTVTDNAGGRNFAGGGVGTQVALGEIRFLGRANTAPAFANASETRSVAENTAAGTDIGNPVTATDADGDALTYALEGPDAASFEIVGTTGQIRTKAALNHEAKNSYSVTVRATDSYVVVARLT